MNLSKMKIKAAYARKMTQTHTYKQHARTKHQEDTLSLLAKTSVSQHSANSSQVDKTKKNCKK